MSLILEVRSLKKYFPVERGIFRQTRGFIRALDGVSFSVNKATTLGIVGKSGSGKSTLAKLLLKLIPITTGEIVYNKDEVTNFRRDVGIIFQNPYQSLNPKMRIRDVLIEPLIVHRLADKHESKNRISASLERVGLGSDVLNRFPIEFSGGQRQRICLARALMVEPKFLVLDEPISSLDLTRQVEILDLLKRLKSKLDLTYVFITHNLNLLKQIADSVLVIDKGKIVQSSR